MKANTPSFLHLVNNGLESHLDYTLGGWGGRSSNNDATLYKPTQPNYVTDRALVEDGNRNKMYWRWVPAAQNDFQARADWCVKGFEEANHAPVARVKGSLRRDVKPGETVTLNATASDPDGDELTIKWWQYSAADSMGTILDLSNSDSLENARFVVPNESRNQIQIILEVTDKGSPPLVGYQRVICDIK